MNPFIIPAFQLTYRFLDHLIGQGDNQLTYLGKGDEIPRHKQTSFRMIPAHKRFKSCQIPPCQIDLRLEMNIELTGSYRSAEIVHQGKTFRGIRVKLGIIKTV